MTKPAAQLECTDIGNARRFVELHANDLRYVPGLGWLGWDGRRWLRDPLEGGEATRRAMTIPEMLLRDAAATTDPDRRAALAKHALASARRNSIDNMVALARAHEAIQRKPEDFDQQHFLFPAANATVDLRTGESRPHRREDALTKCSPVRYDAKAKAPRFLRFLEEVTRGDAELQAYLQRAVGYSLTGDTSEQCLFFLFGSGGNGKGAFLRLLTAIAGDFYRQADFSTFLTQFGMRVREDVAELVGARIVAAEEARGQRQEFDEGLVKSLTGQDLISARFLNKPRFTYRPTFKLWFAANERPRVRGADDGIWRRLRLIPFKYKVENPDHNLEPYLHTHELPGILAWAVRGAVAWTHERLGKPAVVAEATEQYRADEDILADFLQDETVRAPGREVLASDLYARYVGWTTDQGMSPREVLTQTRFGRELAARGFDKSRNAKGQIVRTGLTLRLTVRTVDSSVLSSSHVRALGENYKETVHNCSDPSGNGARYELDERRGLEEGL